MMMCAKKKNPRIIAKALTNSHHVFRTRIWLSVLTVPNNRTKNALKKLLKNGMLQVDEISLYKNINNQIPQNDFL